MDSSSSAAAALKLEIDRLSGAINRFKTGDSQGQARQVNRPNVYVNPNYKPRSNPVYPKTTPYQRPSPPQRPTTPKSQTRDVVIGGVTFQSSGRSLVRKDLAKPATIAPGATSKRPMLPPSRYPRTHDGQAGSTKRAFKPRTSSQNRNMTLANNRRPYQSTKRKLNKPCPRFTTTGSCNRGRTCMYQHDPSKIAICWPFLQGSCPNSADTCPLSHDPTPERTPLCVHFANNGRCTRPDCPFPHVRVGQRHGVCRDFAVLGYCEKGLDCDKQHVRECPDFAEKGVCTTKGCKLPHVIRANRNRKTAPAASASTAPALSGGADSVEPSAGQNPSASAPISSVESGGVADGSSAHRTTAEHAQLGDEFISLTFNEDEDESESEDEDDDDDGDGNNHGNEDSEEEITEQLHHRSPDGGVDSGTYST
ncbi:uncharacterized protein LAESUDRAFT_726907 [Laetiporus sulphureus 93-53]|uniref:C3H1-type domain-containing protein n=1 Tax=Laetiporus sulphureus 93-53 TaxID=1314785 RepID=A0A165DTP5_9APHY|nr:uncharacterized protein LAESUDRAFT_726907 [Laetiporus sulphureus 93-53]KZT05615.1 hypothetical protein LAESUDRAFT_726907 [Laetiporus sulphureus 93-53]